MDMIEAIDQLLPQTQCTRCGYPACRPYAEAISRGVAEINQCPPGGDVTIAALAKLLQVPIKPLNPVHGVHQPLSIAHIDEAQCIGCTLCIQACPVDAIVGAAKHMHTVLASLCTGCELCLPPCPVDCIALLPAKREWSSDDAEAARARYSIRQTRLQQSKEVRRATDQAQRKRSIVEAAILRAKQRRAEQAKL